MKNKDIKEMNKEERFTHLMMLVNTYKRFVIYDIYKDYKYAFEIDKKNFVTAVRIAENILKMQGKEIYFYSLLF